MLPSTRITCRRLGFTTFVWVILPAILILGIRLYWGQKSAQRLQATINQLRSAGIRISPDQLPNEKLIPPNQNAAITIIKLTIQIQKQSESIIMQDSLRPNGWRSPDQWGLDPQKTSDLKLLFAAHGDSFELLDQAETLPFCVWPRIGYGSFDYYELARRLFYAAIFAHENSDEQMALRNVWRLCVLSRCAASDVDTQSDHAFRPLIANLIERIEPTLSLQDPKSTQIAHNILAWLLDDSVALSQDHQFAEARMRRAILWRNQNSNSDEQGWIREPLGSDNLSRFLTSAAAGLPTMQASDWPSTPKIYLSWSYARPLDRIVNSRSHVDPIDPLTIRRTTFYSVARGRAAAILLAARLYAHLHGSPALSAADLVPSIIPKIPADPFATDTQPLHYRLDPAGPTVWSIGSDGRDDAGVVRLTGTGEPNPRDAEPDLVYGAAWRTIYLPATTLPAATPQTVIDRTATTTKPTTQ